MDKKLIIYKTTNILNGKIYIGQHSTYDENDTYLGSGVYLKNAIEKYGKDNFKKEILELCENQEQLSKKEIYWIDKLNSTNPEIGYNISSGGEGANGVIHTDETKQILREITTFRFSNVDNRIKHSEFTKKGMTHIVKEKISIKNKERFNNPSEKQKCKERSIFFHREHPEISENHSKLMKERFANNPELAKEHSDKLKEFYKNNPDYIEECRVRALKQFEDPKQIEIARTNMLERRKDINFEKRRRESVKNAWKDPQKRTNMSNPEMHSKEYLIIFPDYSYEIINNLKKYCVDHGYSYNGMRTVAGGHTLSYKKMLVRHIDKCNTDISIFCKNEYDEYLQKLKISKEEQTKKVKEKMNSEEYVQKARDRMNKRLENPETREMIRQNGLKTSSQEEFRKSKSEMMKEFWKDPQKRTNMSNPKRTLKSYKITFLNGNTEQTSNLREWCKNKGYKYSCMIAVANGHRDKNKDIIKVEKL